MVATCGCVGGSITECWTGLTQLQLAWKVAGRAFLCPQWRHVTGAALLSLQQAQQVQRPLSEVNTARGGCCGWGCAVQSVCSGDARNAKSSAGWMSSLKSPADPQLTRQDDGPALLINIFKILYQRDGGHSLIAGPMIKLSLAT